MEKTVKTSFRTLVLASLAFAAAPLPLLAGHKEEATLEAACTVVDAFGALRLKSIPASLMQEAQGVAIIPNVVKVGFFLGARFGRGVVLVREQGNCWSRPVFITLTGGSFGPQAGVESTDLILVFKTRKSLNRVMKGKGKLTLGAEASVAAGPLGRQAEAATDARLKAEIYSYSRSRGLFAGASVEGATLLMDPRATDAYYRNLGKGGAIPLTPIDEKLRLKLAMLGGVVVETPVIVPPPPPREREHPRLYPETQPLPPPAQPVPVPPPPPYPPR
jgi:lipid-binding SYLF domain-containing protein